MTMRTPSTKIKFICTALFIFAFVSCKKESDSNTTNPPTNGPFFTAAKSLIRSSCAPCHINGGSQGSTSFDTDANIASKKDRIVARAVTIGDMPQGNSLSTAQKKIITDWVNAGGRISD